MGREDIFEIGKKTKVFYKALETGKLSRFESDNKLIRKFVDSKIQGNYRHLIYDCNCPEKTIHKNLVVLKKIMGIVNKPLCELTENDILEMQGKLNRNEIYSENTKTPISYDYKTDIAKVFKQFWTFYRVYAKHEEGKAVENIAEYFRIRKEKNTNQLIKFLTKQELESMIAHCKNMKMRALLKLFFETGARTIEILNLRRFNCSFDEKKGRWIVKLPNMKGISTQKMPIEIEYANADFDAWIKTKDFKDEDYIFDYAYSYFRYEVTELGNKALGRHITPKMFRKSCAMHLVNLDINEQYIKGHMGWSANSKAISHYINQQAIKRPDKLKESFSQDQSGEIAELKTKLKQMEAMMLQKFADNYQK